MPERRLGELCLPISVLQTGGVELPGDCMIVEVRSTENDRLQGMFRIIVEAPYLCKVQYSDVIERVTEADIRFKRSESFKLFQDKKPEDKVEEDPVGKSTKGKITPITTFMEGEKND
jgi:hypothetical protein